MLSEQPVLGIRGMVACAHYLATQAAVSIFTQGGNAIVEGSWEDRLAHTQAILINSHSHIFEEATDPRCDSLALGW